MKKTPEAIQQKIAKLKEKLTTVQENDPHLLEFRKQLKRAQRRLTRAVGEKKGSPKPPAEAKPQKEEKPQEEKSPKEDEKEKSAEGEK
jgi:hypothetical protein